MPEYSVQDVVEIVQNFSPQQKIELQERLSSVLNLNSLPPQESRNNQTVSQTFGDLTVDMSGQGGSFEVGNNTKIDAGGNATLTHSKAQANPDATPSTATNIQQAIEILQFLKTEVREHATLNKLLRKNAEGTIEVVEEELKKSNPDKNLIDEAVDSLQKGLEGVQKLAQPTMKVAELIARAWSGL